MAKGRRTFKEDQLFDHGIHAGRVPVDEFSRGAAMTQSNPGTLQSIYSRSRRICADKAQAHLRDFAVGDNSRSNSEEETVRSDVLEVA